METEERPLRHYHYRIQIQPCSKLYKNALKCLFGDENYFLKIPARRHGTLFPLWEGDTPFKPTWLGRADEQKSPIFRRAKSGNPRLTRQ